MVRSALLMVAALTLALVVQLVWISGLEHRSAQISMFNQFRTELALGHCAPQPHGGSWSHAGPRYPHRPPHHPIIGVKEGGCRGTTSSVLAGGPGHLRNTVFPGGAGTSVILGRAAAFGGPFGQIGSLRKGARNHRHYQVGSSVSG